MPLAGVTESRMEGESDQETLAALPEEPGQEPEIPLDEPPEPARLAPQLRPLHGILGCLVMGLVTLAGIIVVAIVLVVQSHGRPDFGIAERVMPWALGLQTVSQPLGIVIVCVAVGVPVRRGMAAGAAPPWTYVVVAVGTFGCGFVSDYLFALSAAALPNGTASLEAYGELTEAMVQSLGPAGAVLMLALAGAVEELTFRGFLFNSFVSRCRPSLVIALTSVAFAAMHVYPAHVLAVLPVGLYFGLARHLTGSVWPGFTGHALNNALFGLTMLSTQDELDQVLVGAQNHLLAGLGAGLMIGSLVVLQRSRRR